MRSSFLARFLLVIAALVLILSTAWILRSFLWQQAGKLIDLVAPAQSAYTPVAGSLPVQITDSRGVAMSLVPAGTFTMGSEMGYAAEPIHEVYLDDYYMDIYEVTNALYKACVQDGGCALPEDQERYRNPKYKNHPVVYVTWFMAQDYCQWRGGSLPTEAQWEKGARGTDGRTYPWGERIDPTRANYGKYAGVLTAVGSYPRGVSPYGLFDMAGNAQEWVMDWFATHYYSDSPSQNPQGPPIGESASDGSLRVLRGGSWTWSYFGVRSADRYYASPRDSYDSIGFRCAQTP